MFSRYDDSDTLHVENVELEDVRLQEHYRKMDISLTVTYRELECDCTSTMGDQTVTQTWEEYEIYDLLVNSVTIKSNDAYIPNDFLTQKDIEVIKEIIPEYEP